MRTELNETMPPSITPAQKWGMIPVHGRILLAEDGRDSQRLFAMQLHDCGAEVTIAENGLIALNFAARSSFDLVLMDMQMPVMDGYTAVAEMRRQGFTMPIIALTASATDEDRKKTIASGCDDYLSKPVDQNVLLETVSKYMGKKPPGPLPRQSPETPVAAKDAAQDRNEL